MARPTDSNEAARRYVADMEDCYHWATEEGDIKLIELHEHGFRLSGRGLELDLFPSTKKYHNVSQDFRGVYASAVSFAASLFRKQRREGGLQVADVIGPDAAFAIACQRQYSEDYDIPGGPPAAPDAVPVSAALPYPERYWTTAGGNMIPQFVQLRSPEILSKAFVLMETLHPFVMAKAWFFSSAADVQLFLKQQSYPRRQVPGYNIVLTYHGTAAVLDDIAPEDPQATICRMADYFADLVAASRPARYKRYISR